jgi:cob(I)alamin adenosyltransferase
VPLVEPPRAFVLLEDPKLEALGTDSLRVVEEGRANPASLRLGTHVEVRELLILDAAEADDPPLVLGEPDRTALDEPPPEHVSHVVPDTREIFHLVARRREDFAQRSRVLSLRASDHGRNLGCVPRRREEPVRLTRIYTRGGDAGQTSLGDGSRVPKTDRRVAAMGDVDELNSLLGWAASGAWSERLERIQNELFDLGADLAVPLDADGGRLRIEQDAIDRLETDIDEVNAALEPLKSFVLPGGSEQAARLFVVRAVCRRAERAVLAVTDANPLAAVYLNRLSDLLFVLARAANTGREEPLWKPGG